MSSTFGKALTAAAALALAGCGSDPGSGTETLYVEATARTDGSSGGTQLIVVVRQDSANGECITDATVTMIGEKGSEHALPYEGVGCFGWYRKSNLAWESGWRLRIESGADKLEGFVAGPGVTTIESPTPGQAFSRGAQEPLRVRWKDESGRSAETVEVRLDEGDYEVARTDDPGQREIPYTVWSQAVDQERVEVIRTTDVNLAGGVTGSFLRAISTARVQFEVQ